MNSILVLRFSGALALLIAACSSQADPPTEMTRNQAAPALATGTTPAGAARRSPAAAAVSQRIAGDSRLGKMILPSEANAGARHVDLSWQRQLPTNSQALSAAERAAKASRKEADVAARPADALVARAVPAEMLKKQAAYLAARSSKDAELAGLAPEERDAALSALKHQLIGE